MGAVVALSLIAAGAATGGAMQAAGPLGGQTVASADVTGPRNPAVPATTNASEARPPLPPSSLWEEDYRFDIPGRDVLKNTEPLLQWTHRHPDGLTQSGYQVVIRNADTGEVIYNTGKISGLSAAEPPSTHEAVYASDPRGWEQNHKVMSFVLSRAGTDHFKWRVRTWDTNDRASDWSAEKDFWIMSLPEAWVTGISNPPKGQKPPPLPFRQARVRAGSRFTYKVVTVGPVRSVSAGLTLCVRPGEGCPPPPPNSFHAMTPLHPTNGLEVPRWNEWTDTYATNVDDPNNATYTVDFKIQSTDPRLDFTSFDTGVVTIAEPILTEWVVVPVR